jgi:hypothetical protein
MEMLLSLILLTSGLVQIDRPSRYLVSIADVPLEANESIEGFTLSTWGARFSTVCQIPSGWTIKAGGSLTPEGVLEGQGSHGTSWFAEASPPELREFALVTLYGPVQRDAVNLPDGSGGVPATFAGSATISTDDGEKQVALTTDNVRLTPADRCPER